MHDGGESRVLHAIFPQELTWRFFRVVECKSEECVGRSVRGDNGDDDDKGEIG